MLEPDKWAEAATLIVEVDELAKALDRFARSPKFRARVVVPQVERLATRALALRLSVSMGGGPLDLLADLDRVADSLRQVRLVSEVSRTDATWLATLRLIESYVSRLHKVVSQESIKVAIEFPAQR